MATTTYPKSYVLDRISARRVSLQRKRKTDETIVSDADAVIADVMTEHLPRVIADIEAALKLARKSKMVGDYSKDEQTIERIQRQVRDAGGESPLNHTWNKVEQQPGRKAILDRQSATARIRDYDREIDTLEHTEAYLKGTPVDQFSLTQIKQLGLLDIIKFDLAAAREEAAGR